MPPVAQLNAVKGVFAPPITALHCRPVPPATAVSTHVGCTSPCGMPVFPAIIRNSRAEPTGVTAGGIPPGPAGVPVKPAVSRIPVLAITPFSTVTKLPLASRANLNAGVPPTTVPSRVPTVLSTPLTKPITPPAVFWALRSKQVLSGSSTSCPAALWARMAAADATRVEVFILSSDFKLLLSERIGSETKKQDQTND
jgi:hypothetical protein